MATDYYVDNVLGDNLNLGTSPGAGNAWATIQYSADNANVAGDRVFIKNTGTTYTLSATCDFDTNAGGVTGPIEFIGYTTTVTDKGLAVVTKAGGVNDLFDSTQGYLHWENFELYGADAKGMDLNGGYGLVRNCKVHDNTGDNLELSVGHWNVVNCEIYNSGASGYGLELASAGCMVTNCYIHDNTYGIICGQEVVFFGNIIEQNSNHGLRFDDNQKGWFINNTFDANVGYGLLIDQDAYSIQIINNIFSNHDTGGEVGLKLDSGEYAINSYVDYNAYYNNDDDISGFSLGANSVELSSNPYTTAGSDWSLNSTSGGGADCKGAGIGGPVGLIGSPINTGSLDIGAIQSAGGVGGGSYAFVG